VDALQPRPRAGGRSELVHRVLFVDDARVDALQERLATSPRDQGDAPRYPPLEPRDDFAVVLGLYQGLEILKLGDPLVLSDPVGLMPFSLAR
jgi:hypothetical protein